MAAGKRERGFVRHGAIVLGGLVALNIGNYLFYGLVGRIAGVEAYGTISALFSALFLIMSAASIAATVIARLAAELWIAEDVRRLKRLADVTSVGTLILGVTIALVTLVLREPISHFFALPDSSAVTAMAVALPFVLVLPVQRAIFQGSESYWPYTWSNCIEGVAKAGAGAALALPLGAAGALYGVAVASAVAWIFDVAATWTIYGRRSARLRLPPETLQTTIVYVTVTVLAIYGLLFYDVILVKHFFPARTAGLYGASALVGRTIYFILGFVPTIVLPKSTSLAGAGQSQRGLLARAAGMSLSIVGAALGLCFWQPARIVTFLSGAAFADAASYVPIYAVAISALALANIIAMSQIGRRSYAFVWPLGFVALSEFAAVALHHDSIRTVVSIVCLGHILALAATCFRLDISRTF